LQGCLSKKGFQLAAHAANASFLVISSPLQEMHEGHTTMQSAINATGTTPIHVVTRLIAKPATQTGALQLHETT